MVSRNIRVIRGKPADVGISLTVRNRSNQGMKMQYEPEARSQISYSRSRTPGRQRTNEQRPTRARTFTQPASQSSAYEMIQPRSIHSLPSTKQVTRGRSLKAENFARNDSLPRKQSNKHVGTHPRRRRSPSRRFDEEEEIARQSCLFQVRRSLSPKTWRRMDEKVAKNVVTEVRTAIGRPYRQRDGHSRRLFDADQGGEYEEPTQCKKPPTGPTKLREPRQPQLQPVPDSLRQTGRTTGGRSSSFDNYQCLRLSESNSIVASQNSPVIQQGVITTMSFTDSFKECFGSALCGMIPLSIPQAKTSASIKEKTWEEIVAATAVLNQKLEAAQKLASEVDAETMFELQQAINKIREHSARIQQLENEASLRNSLVTQKDSDNAFAGDLDSGVERTNSSKQWTDKMNLTCLGLDKSSAMCEGHNEIFEKRDDKTIGSDRFVGNRQLYSF